MECLWYCFSPVIQGELNSARDHWNTHYIWRSRDNTVSGRPDSLFFMPEHHDAVDMLVHVSSRETEYVSRHIIEEVPVHEFQVF